MNLAASRMLCRILIVLMAWMPFHVAHAGVIGTEKALASVQVERTSLLNLVSRADIASQLQAHGIDAATAADRVAALTDEEVRSIAGRIATLPAGADGGLVVLVLVGVILWLVFWKK